jgi:hypothetical protein
MIQSEYRIHVAIVNHTWDCFPQIEFTHAGKARDETHAHFLQRMGYMAGTGDLVWFCAGKFGELEIKRPGGTQSSDQKTREAKLLRNGGHYVIVKSVREAHDYWKSLGFTPRHERVIEPDLRTDEQKKRDALDLYRPHNRPKPLTYASALCRCLSALVCGIYAYARRVSRAFSPDFQ